MSFVFCGESKSLNEFTRAILPGDFIKLRDGVTHFELKGPKDGQTVILVHGFSVPSYIWDPTFNALLKAGLRVLRYDLFGRGTSDRPKIPYDPDLFDRQLSDLIQVLDIELPVDLIGLSMGGAVVITFCDRHPELVRNLVLIDPVGGHPISLTPILKLILVPGLGELLLGWFGSQSLLKGMAEDFFKPDNICNFLERYKVQMTYRGFKRALIRTLRADMLGDFTAIYRRVGSQNRAKLLIWGREDQTIPIAHSQIILDSMPGTIFHVVENAGHIPHYECPEIVNSLILSFLQSSE